jgi:hypothetical protein
VIIPRGSDGLPSLLGVEMDGGLIPRQFNDLARGGVEQGDRMAVFGRWIVDCGHQVPITSCDGTDLHKGITASLVAPVALDAREFTRVLFTSRPYLVSQRFTTDTGKIYDDAASDDGPFSPHMIREVVKAHETLLRIPTASIQVRGAPEDQVVSVPRFL